MSNTVREWAIRHRLPSDDPRRQKARELVWRLMDRKGFVLVLKEAK